MAESDAKAKARRTVPVRLEPDLHAQLVLMARLAAMSVNDLISWAIQDKLASLQQDPEIHGRANELQASLARDAQAQADALASLLEAKPAPAKAARQRRAGSEE